VFSTVYLAVYRLPPQSQAAANRTPSEKVVERVDIETCFSIKYSKMIILGAYSLCPVL
jgi:hypothetical protein